jgi:8-oxo-dGTP pyrophosphatase MutT (NUDIX family)
MNLTPDIAIIKQALAQPLPGLAAILPMIPPHRRAELARYLIPPTCRQAAALVLLYPHNGEWHLPLTRRTDSVETHKGQVSLPGGAQEEGESLQETALREAHEEVAVDPAQIEILGALSSVYIPPSNFCLHPFVACATHRPAFCPLPDEVAELIETPLAALSDPANLREEGWLIQGQTMRIPFYQLGPHKVWGATAMVLAEFVAALDRPVLPAVDLQIGD